MNHILFLDTSSIRHSISVLGSKDIFQHLKKHKSCMGGQTKACIKHGNQILTQKWKSIWINITQYTRIQFIASNINKQVQLSMVEDLGFTNRRDREEMETKEKMQALSQGSWQYYMLQLCLPFVSPSPIRNPSSSPTPKRGKTHHEWRRRPNEEWESFPTPLATSKRLSKHPKVFLCGVK